MKGRVIMESTSVNYPEMIVEKSKGLTLSEQKLTALGYQTFLRLWSYPNPYKMQPNGKELCDLLIVFDNHIVTVKRSGGQTNAPRNEKIMTGIIGNSRHTI